MLRPKQTVTRFLSATLIVLAASQLSAFEQSTYFIYQLTDQSDSPAIAKRLVLDRQFFAEAETTQATIEPETVERSEFEMDYNSFGTKSNSTFENTQTTKQTADDTSLFDIGPKETISLFGD